MAGTTLVIGGTRNVGPDLVAALLARGDRVTVLNRGVTLSDLPPEVERLYADRSDVRAIAAALAGRAFDAVIDTTLYTGDDAATLTRTLRGHVGRYVFWSTGQVYLVRTGVRAPFAESDYPGPIMPEPPATATADHDNWIYGVDKRAAEDALRTAFDRDAFPYVSLRMPMINSARDPYWRLAAYVHRILDGHPILVPDDQDRLPLRHVFGGDVVTASLRASESGTPAGTCLNISQDETLTLEGMLRRTADVLGRPFRTIALPRDVLVEKGLLPNCSPWSGLWMSAVDNARSKDILGMRYTPVAACLPALVAAALRVPLTLVPGNDRRREEIALADAQE